LRRGRDSIDLHELPGGNSPSAIRTATYRRSWSSFATWKGDLEEFRAHIAEWLGELYYESGALAYDGEAMLHLLRKKSEEAEGVRGEGDRC